jgi:hypothetical protein
MYGVGFAIERRVNIDVAAPFCLGSKASDTGDRSVLNRFISFEYIALIHNVRRCRAVSQPDIVQSSFVYSVEVGGIVAIEIKVLPMLQGVKYYPARCDNARLLDHYR